MSAQISNEFLDIMANEMSTMFKEMMKSVLLSFTSEFSKTHKISIEDVILIWNKALPQFKYNVHIPVVNETKCNFVLVRGKNKGEKCGKNTKNEKYCSTHNKEKIQNKQENNEEEVNEKQENNEEENKEKQENNEEEVNEKHTGCNFVLVRGKNKGEKCGKKTLKNEKYCSTHNKKEKKNKETEIEENDDKENKETEIETEIEDNDNEKNEKKKKEKKKKDTQIETETEDNDNKKNEKKKKDTEIETDNETEIETDNENEKKEKKMKEIEKENEKKENEKKEKKMKEIEKENEDEDDDLSFEKCKKNLFIKSKINEDSEIICEMSKEKLEKFLGKNIKLSGGEYLETGFPVSINAFPRGLNIFYEDGEDMNSLKKEQTKILKLRFNKYHSIIHDYLSELI